MKTAALFERNQTPATTAAPQRSGEFRRIVVGTVLFLAAVAALLYFTAEPSDLDLTRTPKFHECPLHHSALTVARAPITYEPAASLGDYLRAAHTSFPLAGSFVLASNYNSEEWEFQYRFARVWQCPDCVRAEQRWYNPDGQSK